jgi:DNA-binding phage protein
MSFRQKAFLEHKEVMELLRSEIARAGGQGRWAKMMGMDRTQLSKMLHGPQLLSKRVIKALKLHVVFAPDDRKEEARGMKNQEQKVGADPQELLAALRELVEQVESSNARDDHGHPLKNLKALRDARAIVDEVGGKIEP